MSEMEIKEPKHLKVFRILGFFTIIIGIAMIVFGAIMIEQSELYFLLLAGGVVVVFFGIMFTIEGFSAKIDIAEAKTQRYTAQATEGEMTDIANIHADVVDDAVTNTVKAVKKGLKNTKYCKYCGEEIDADSRFCNYCGKSQL